jgi:transcriptional regulator with XRE-family HTH domain
VKSPEAELFGQTLRRLRDDRGLTQEKLARAANLTTSFVSEIERGVTMVSLNTILKLAQGLACSPADLLADFTPARIRHVLR